MYESKATLFFIALLFFVAAVDGQTGGGYEITQSVIANGGGQNTTGGQFSLDGTIGQAIAGGVLAGSPFAITSGFWNFAPLVPTAATVSVSGRVFSARGRGLPRAVVLFSDASGEARSVVANNFGYYRFENVLVGETYIFEVRSKNYLFAPQVVTVTEEITELNFRLAP